MELVTTFMKMLAGKDKDVPDVPKLSVSYKPQMITPTFDGTVQELFRQKLQDGHRNAQFQTDVYKPLRIEDLEDNEVKKLSGGELQRVALILALGNSKKSWGQCDSVIYLLYSPNIDSDCY